MPTPRPARRPVPPAPPPRTPEPIPLPFEGVCATLQPTTRVIEDQRAAVAASFRELDRIAARVETAPAREPDREDARARVRADRAALERVARRIHRTADALPPPVPMLASGLEAATLATSTAAAASVDAIKDQQRAAVLAAIRATGARGATDDDLQAALGLDGNSERPRRWELWNAGQIRILKDAEGVSIKRITRSHRRAVVWVIAPEAQ